MTSVDEVLSRLTMTSVCCALGIEPHHGRIAAPWRETRDRNVSLSDAKGAWFDHAAGEGGGVLDLVSKVRGGTRADALRWCSDLAGVPLDDKPFTAADRRRWAAERRALERDLPAASYWRRAALALADQQLTLLKSRLFDPLPLEAPSHKPARLPDFEGIYWWTAMHARLSKLDGAALVEAFREATRREPRITAGMVTWARDREEIEIDALLEYLFGAEVAA